MKARDDAVKKYDKWKAAFAKSEKECLKRRKLAMKAVKAHNAKI